MLVLHWQLPSSAAANFRVTCRLADEATRPQFFRHAIWNVSKLMSDEVTENRRSNACISPTSYEWFLAHHARTEVYMRELRLVSTGFDLESATTRTQMYNGLVHVLSKAIDASTNLRVFRWKIDSDTGEMGCAVITHLANLPSLRDIRIIFNTQFQSPELPIHRLAHLHRIDVAGTSGNMGAQILSPLAEVVAASPDLVSLTIGVVGPWINTPGLRPLLLGVPSEQPLRLKELRLVGFPSGNVLSGNDTLLHLRELKVLEIAGLGIGAIGQQSSEDLWRALQREGIQLLRLTVQVIDEALIEYLASFAGLSELNLTVDGHEELSDQFYGRVLPRHASALRKLKIATSNEGRWSFGAHNADAFLQCVEMREMSLPIMTGSGSVQRADGFRLETALSTFLRTLGQLRYLQTLAISSPQSTPARLHQEMNMWLRSRAVNGSLQRCLEGLNLPEGATYPPRVVLDGKIFERRSAHKQGIACTKYFHMLRETLPLRGNLHRFA
ncbi:hypothetical protein HGRIS_005058 [Hohenbuehelia grisea]|uniref:Uncharacterized protein n=1 Tax=Hohenbuehelia grisea TaxID=104357 RepID=A0ABR3JEA5_9AGAR